MAEDHIAPLRAIAEELVDEWSLDVDGPAFASGISIVLPVRRRDDGRAAVLKVQPPDDRESEHEAEALARWNGCGAVELLARNDQHAFLIERCEPGSPLSLVGQDAALAVYTDLLPRLWISVDQPFQTLAAEAALWAEHLPQEWEDANRPYERRLLDAALDTLATLANSQGEQVLLHQDLHADNILRASREPWLVIDPKPLVGEREFAMAPIARSREIGHSRAHVFGRLDRLTSELGLDRARACAWSFAQTLAWGFSNQPPLEVIETHLETARWLEERM